MTDKKKVLLIGSGLAANLVKDFDIPDDWIVCVIHNAWRVVPERWDILFHAQDFSDEKKPTVVKPNQQLQETYDYVVNQFADDIRGGFARKHYGFGKTMFFSSFWWIMDNLKPDIIGFVGCDMDYPEHGNNTIYGKGSPDPLKYPLKRLLCWLGYLDGFCVRDNIMLINYSPYESPTLLPFSHGIFPEVKPIERAREHRCQGEYWPEITV